MSAFAKVPTSVITDRRLSALDVRVYAAIALHANRAGECWPGQERIAELACIKRRAVGRSLNRLAEAGHIERVRRGRMLSNFYRVTGQQRPLTPEVMGPAVPITREVMGPAVPSDGSRRAHVMGPAGPTNQTNEPDQKNKTLPHARGHTTARTDTGGKETEVVDVSVQLTDGGNAWVRDEAGLILGPATSDYTSAPTNGHRPSASDPPGFAEFWQLWPRHVGKRPAAKAFVAACSRAPATEVIAGARRVAADPNLPEPKFIPHPATWLNRDGWEDDPFPERRNGNGKRGRTGAAIAAASGPPARPDAIDVPSREVTG